MDELLIEADGPVRTLTLDRPEARNALSAALRDRLSRALAEAEADEGVLVVILTGTDPSFCAGLDLREIGARGIGPDEVVRADQSPFWILHSMRTPVIGAVNGPAVTGGLEIALQCSCYRSSVPWPRRWLWPTRPPSPHPALLKRRLRRNLLPFCVVRLARYRQFWLRFSCASRIYRRWHENLTTWGTRSPRQSPSLRP